MYVKNIEPSAKREVQSERAQSATIRYFGAQSATIGLRALGALKFLFVYFYLTVHWSIFRRIIRSRKIQI